MCHTMNILEIFSHQSSFERNEKAVFYFKYFV